MQADQNLARNMRKASCSQQGLHRQRQSASKRQYGKLASPIRIGYGKRCCRQQEETNPLHNSFNWMRGASDSESAIVKNAVFTN
jgi:hypothetical protein